MDPTPLPQIPHELLRPVFAHLKDDRPSLCLVSVYSSAFRQEAQSVLFRDLTLTSLKNYDSILKFLRTVTKSPDRLALLVRTFGISWAILSRELVTAIRKGLKVMKNLKDLTLCIACSLFEIPESLASMLEECTFQLDRLDWNGSPRDCRRLFKIFLPAQGSLKHLRIHSTRQAIWKYPIIGSATCPQLISLEGTWSMLKAMLPHCKIETLVMSYDLGDTSGENDMPPLSLALRYVKVLHYSFPVSNPPGPDPVLLHCPSLTILVLVYSINVEEEALSAVLSKMPSLHTLIFSTDNSQILVEDAQQLALRIFQRYSLSIQCIYVQVDEVEYRWYRHVGGVFITTIVSAGEVRKLWVPY